jgi:hypothetical protein
MNADILSKEVTQSARETVNGVSAKLFNADMGAEGKARAWVEPKYGLTMRAEVTAPNTAPRVILQTQTVSFAKTAAWQVKFTGRMQHNSRGGSFDR